MCVICTVHIYMFSKPISIVQVCDWKRMKRKRTPSSGHMCCLCSTHTITVTSCHATLMKPLGFSSRHLCQKQCQWESLWLWCCLTNSIAARIKLKSEAYTNRLCSHWRALMPTLMQWREGSSGLCCRTVWIHQAMGIISFRGYNAIFITTFAFAFAISAQKKAQFWEY